MSEDDLWYVYQQQEKQTIKELSERLKSVATIKRRLQGIRREWVQSPLSVRVSFIWM